MAGHQGATAMKTSDTDRIVSSMPVNRVAARVMAPGEHWTPDLVRDDTWQDLPLKVLPPPKHAAPGQMLQPGQRFGRLTVLGYGGKGWDGGKYVCRCDCGKFGYRRAASLRRPKVAPMCDHCDYLEAMKAGTKPSPHEREQARLLKARAVAEARGKSVTLGAILGPALRRAGANRGAARPRRAAIGW